MCDWQQYLRTGCRSNRPHRVARIVVPSDPNVLQTTFMPWTICQRRKCNPHVLQNTRWHVPDECFQVYHPSYRQRNQRTEQFPCFLVHGVFFNPNRRSIPNRELARVLCKIISPSRPFDARSGCCSGALAIATTVRTRSRRRIGWRKRVENVFAHDQCCQTIRECIHTTRRISSG